MLSLLPPCPEWPSGSEACFPPPRMLAPALLPAGGDFSPASMVTLFIAAVTLAIGHSGFPSDLFLKGMALKSGHLFLFLFFVCLPFPGLLPSACGGSQARGRIGAVAAGLHLSHSHTRPEPRLRPTPQLTATPDPEPTERGQGSNPQPHGSSSDSLTTVPRRELPRVGICDDRFCCTLL